MSDNVVKFSYSASRRVHSKKPRRSKERHTGGGRRNFAAMETTQTDVVDLSPQIDRGKLRSCPLRDHVATISFGATVVGKMHTAGLRGEPLKAIQPEIRK
jgi:hypothetical protein